MKLVLEDQWKFHLLNEESIILIPSLLLILNIAITWEIEIKRSKLNLKYYDRFICDIQYKDLFYSVIRLNMVFEIAKIEMRGNDADHTEMVVDK